MHLSEHILWFLGLYHLRLVGKWRCICAGGRGVTHFGQHELLKIHLDFSMYMSFISKYSEHLISSVCWVTMLYPWG